MTIRAENEMTLVRVDDGEQGPQGETGEQGQDGYTPYIGQNGNWWINGQDTGHSAEGDDGHSPYVDDNTSTWWEWDASAVPPAYHDTEIEPQGPQGIQGDRGETGEQGPQGETGEQGPQGEDGERGTDGHSPQVTATRSGDTVTIKVDDVTIASIKDGTDGAAGTPGAAGADGKTSYLHIAYATNSTGTTGFSTTDPVGKTYIGQYTDFVAADSTDPANYSWTLIKGETGEQGPQGETGEQGPQGETGEQGPQGSTPTIGANKYWYIDGVSTGIKAEGTDGDSGTPIVWKGSLASAPSNPVVDWCYRNTTDGKVYIYNGSAWALMTQDGEQGPQGISLNSVTRYYKLSDTTPTDYPPSTGWQTSEPAYTPGDAMNLYICDLFAWSNSTVTASEISLSSSYEAAKQAYNAAQGALTAANNKNTIFHQSTQPTGGTYKVGDTWFDTDDGYKMYTYNGTAWVAEQLGANAIADLAITNAKIANGTIQNAKIATIDAGKITTGTINADRIAANSLTIGKITTADQEQILNSNVQVGGRNWLQKTGDLSQWYHDTTYVTGNDFNGSEVNLGHGAELSWSYYIYSSYENLVLPYADVKDKQFTISFEAKVDVVGSGTSERLSYSVGGQATAGGSRTKYTGFYIYNNSTSTDHLDTEYKKFSRTLTINDALFTSGSGDVNFVYFSFWNYSLANISVRNIKLELGNKATDWTPAVEDVGDNVITQIQNLTPKIFYAYSSSSNGCDNFSITNSDLQYVGEYTSMSSEQSLNYSDYTWGINPSWASKYADNYIMPISGGGIKLISPDVSTYAGLTPIALAFYLGDIEQARIGYDSDLMNAYGVVASNIFAYGNGSGVRFDNSEQAVIAGGDRGKFTWEVRQNGHLSLKRL